MKLFKLFKKQKKKPQEAPQLPPVVKKNTWLRNLKAWDLRLDRRQQERNTLPEIDNTERVCTNCGEKYVGQYCPQCGQAGTWDRFSVRRVILNILDIWGLGNRPMFRTMHDLFWRPGYMVRDYLRGHRQFYFPPFKLLALMVVFTFFVHWLTRQKYGEDLSFLKDIPLDSYNLPDFVITLAEWGIKLLEFLFANPLYEYLVITGVLVCVVRVAFRKICNYNFVETFIFLIYLTSMTLLVDIPDTLISGIYNLVEKYYLLPIKESSPMMFSSLSAIGTGLTSLVSTLCIALLCYTYVTGFRQFFGLNWESTIKRMLYAIWIAFIGLCLFTLFTFATKQGIVYLGAAVLSIVIAAVSFQLIMRYILKNKTSVSGFIYHLSIITCLAQFVVLLFFDTGILMSESPSIKPFSYVMIVTLLIFFSTAFMAILPILLYKKTHRHWIAVMPQIITPFFVFIILLLIAKKFHHWLNNKLTK